MNKLTTIAIGIFSMVLLLVFSLLLTLLKCFMYPFGQFSHAIRIGTLGYVFVLGSDEHSYVYWHLTIVFLDLCNSDIICFMLMTISVSLPFHTFSMEG